MNNFLFKTAFTIIKWNSNILAFAGLCETKIWRKSKAMLNGYRHFHCMHKNRRYL